METQTRPYRPKSESVGVDDSRGRRRYERSPSFGRRCRRSRSRSIHRDRSSMRKNSREREYDRKSGRERECDQKNSREKECGNSLHSATSYPPQVSYNTAQRTLPSDPNQQTYPTQYAAQDSDYYNYNYSKISYHDGHQQAAEYGNEATDFEVDEELMRKVKEIFSDDDDDEDEKPPLAVPEITSMSAATHRRTSPGPSKGQAMSLPSPGDNITSSNSPSAVPESLYLKIQSQLARINNIKLLQERIQSRNESIYMALINHWKMDVEEMYSLFKIEHEFLEKNWPASLMDHEYFTNGAHKEMYTVYSSIMVTLADMEQEILKNIEQDQLDSSRRILLTNRLNQLDDIPPQTRNDPSSLNTIATSFAKFRKEIHSLVSKEHVGDCLLIHRMTQLLDRPTREAWNDSLGNSKKIPTFEEFDNFLAKRVRALEGIDSVSSTTKDISSTPPRRIARVSALERLDLVPSSTRRREPRAYTRSPIRPTQSSRSGSKETIKNRLKIGKVGHSTRISKHPCAYCMEQHFVVTCPSFRLLSSEERREFVIEEHLCFNCLGPHSAKNCMSKINCKICEGNHHTMIHIS